VSAILSLVLVLSLDVPLDQTSSDVAVEDLDTHLTLLARAR
jgi:hypothetical protein